MLPVGPLMIEHRLIERMIKVMKQKLAEMDAAQAVDPVFVDTAVDFLRTYADRCHHGKEEDILFRELAQKPLSPDLKGILDELIAEHQQARRLVGHMLEAKERWLRGEKGALTAVLQPMGKLVEFYPDHIAKEDKRLFLPCMEYFGPKEREALLQEGHEFDRKLIHERYLHVVEQHGG